jgi:hypothetical protein
LRCQRSVVTGFAPLPEFNPSLLMMRVRELLAREEISVVVDLGHSRCRRRRFVEVLGRLLASVPWRPKGTG